MRGGLILDGKAAKPQNVRAPLLSVLDPRSTVVPPQATLAFHRAAATTDRNILWLSGDIGIALQHVGPLVGATAHRQLWPKILGWMHERWAGA